MFHSTAITKIRLSFMWSPGAVVVVILLNLLTVFTCPDPSNISSALGKVRPSALIHYPEAALEYFFKIRAHPAYSACLTEFENHQRTRRLETCVKYLVGAESFSLLLDRTDYITKDFKNSVKATFESAPDTLLREFSFEGSDGNTYETTAHLCAVNADGKWTISPSCQEGVMLLHVQQSSFLPYKLSALLEEAPYVKPWDQQRTEKWFTSNRTYRAKIDNLYSEDESITITSRSLCEMDDFERFRACSVGFLAWRYSTNDRAEDGEVDGVARRKGNFIDWEFPSDQPRCITSKLKLSIEVENEDEIPIIDVIPCAINREMKFAEFFLTRDPFSPTSMFTVLPAWKNDVHGFLGDKNDALVKLELYMTNVRVLESFNRTV